MSFAGAADVALCSDLRFAIREDDSHVCLLGNKLVGEELHGKQCSSNHVFLFGKARESNVRRNMCSIEQGRETNVASNHVFLFGKGKLRLLRGPRRIMSQVHVFVEQGRETKAASNHDFDRARQEKQSSSNHVFSFGKLVGEVESCHIVC